MKAMIFAVASGILIYISRHSLRVPRSHGFYRFFAWECILAIFLLNVEFWFFQPFDWNQILSWILLAASVIPLAFGVYKLRTKGGPRAGREGDESLLVFEKTTTLVTDGIYRYIRHPLYSSLLLLLWGIFFKVPTVAGGTLAATGTTFLIATAGADEQECMKYFGESYASYMKHTKRFLPFIY